MLKIGRAEPKDITIHPDTTSPVLSSLSLETESLTPSLRASSTLLRLSLSFINHLYLYKLYLGPQYEQRMTSECLGVCESKRKKEKEKEKRKRKEEGRRDRFAFKLFLNRWICLQAALPVHIL